jgi:hypothetical protein
MFIQESLRTSSYLTRYERVSVCWARELLSCIRMENGEAIGRDELHDTESS